MHLDSVDQKLSREYVKNDMTAKLGGDPHLINHLIPAFALGCRRMTPGTQYLQSLRKENVQVLTEGAIAFTEDGIIGESGTETKVDVIVCATGFNVTLPRYKIYGKNGRTLDQEWVGFPKAYLSVMAGSMPNLYCKFLLVHSTLQ
jgi:cation diffusion facilitator CzcD-associated flavoprotein CzcO